MIYRCQLCVGGGATLESFAQHMRCRHGERITVQECERAMNGSQRRFAIARRSVNGEWKLRRGCPYKLRARAEATAANFGDGYKVVELANGVPIPAPPETEPRG